MAATSIDTIVDWLLQQGLAGTSEVALLAGFCDRLNELGFDIERAAVGSSILHPVHTARAFIWRADRGCWQEDYGDGTSTGDRDNWDRSPFRYLIENKINHFFRPLDNTHKRAEFPLLDDLQDAGCTGYIATAVYYGESASLGDLDGILCSLTTRRRDQFTEQELKDLDRLARHFAHAFKTISTVTTGRTLMSTYLGVDAGARVLRGEIRRGVAESVDAIFWYSDLEGFTRLTESIEPDRVMEMLNDYADCLVGIIHDHGGEVLKFMGDGLLAMFPLTGFQAACDCALDAAIDARRKLEQVNRRRLAEGVPTTDFHLALHRGEVLYGNIGSRDRLDFTVVGPAVNELARIETLCRSLDQKIVISSAFAEVAGTRRERLISLGRYMLKGVGRPQELFTIDPDEMGGDGQFDDRHSAMVPAE